MNNMKYYNDSLAYDFERFMPQTQPKEYDNIVKMPQSRTKAKSKARQRKATRSMAKSITVAFVGILLMAALFGNINLRVKINEVNTQINTEKSELDALKSEKTALQVEVDRRISYCNIEEAAKKLGMVKREKSQIRYITMNERNAAVIGDELVVSDEE